MSMTIVLAPQVEAALQVEAARNGVAAEELASRVISREFQARPPTAHELMLLPSEQRAAYLEAAAEAAAPLYTADLAKPAAERELAQLPQLERSQRWC